MQPGDTLAGEIGVVPIARRRRAAPPLPPLALLVALVAVSLAAAVLILDRRVAQLAAEPRPRVPSIDVYELFADNSPIAITLTADWQKIPLVVPADALRSNGLLWRSMHFDDWDRVPAGLRAEGIERMWRQYAGIARTPAKWDRMDALDWDGVPQPVRAMAFIEMIRYWSGHYQIGGEWYLPRALVADTLAAIVMVESWFDHRAVSVSRSGNRDLGLAQASDYTRATLTRLHGAGVVDFAPATDADHFDPWQSARVAAIWLGLMLRELSGDLPAAVRAYHVGSPAADAGDGGAYLQRVEDKRIRYVRNAGGPPSWDLLFRLAVAER